MVTTMCLLSTWDSIRRILWFYYTKRVWISFYSSKNGNSCQRNDWYRLEVVEAIVQIIGNFSVQLPVSAHWFYDLCKLVCVDFDYLLLNPVQFSSDLVTIVLSSLRLVEIGNFSVRLLVSAHWFYDLCKLVWVDFDYP